LAYCRCSDSHLRTSFLVCATVPMIIMHTIIESSRTPNNSVETNRRPASPLSAGREFGSTSCAPPFLSAAVGHLSR
jgi:hypothetical protein